MISDRYCRDCRNAKRRDNRSKGLYPNERDRKGHHYARYYGITETDYQQLLKEQGGSCACCGAPPRKKRLAVDHDHESGAVRGLLCINCNSMIGHADDRIHRLKLAIAYLRSHGMIELEITANSDNLPRRAARHHRAIHSAPAQWRAVLRDLDTLSPAMIRRSSAVPGGSRDFEEINEKDHTRR